jgi:CheY-like chemotaxis protein
MVARRKERGLAGDSPRDADRKIAPEGPMDIRKHLNILIAVDHKNILRMLSIVICGMGHNPMTAKDGKEALDMFILQRERGEPVDLVITDFDMPRMDGLELLKALKTIAPEVPVIIMTSHYNTIDEKLRERLRQMEECGALAVMDKNISIIDLERAVEMAKGSLNE